VTTLSNRLPGRKLRDRRVPPCPPFLRGGESGAGESDVPVLQPPVLKTGRPDEDRSRREEVEAGRPDGRVLQHDTHTALSAIGHRSYESVNSSTCGHAHDALRADRSDIDVARSPVGTILSIRSAGVTLGDRHNSSTIRTGRESRVLRVRGTSLAAGAAQRFVRIDAVPRRRADTDARTKGGARVRRWLPGVFAIS